MSFFEMPAWQPPSGYRIPTWLRPPEAMVPGIVPVELLVARTDTHAVLVTDLHAYPTGLEFTLTGRSRPDLPDPRRHDPDRPPHLRFAYRNAWLELHFADGRTADNDPRRWPRPSGDQPPDPPLLYQSTVGEDGGHVWLWGLPPPGPLTFACQWPAEQIPPSQALLDARLVLAAAARAQTLWPEEPRA